MTILTASPITSLADRLARVRALHFETPRKDSEHNEERGRERTPLESRSPSLDGIPLLRTPRGRIDR